MMGLSLPVWVAIAEGELGARPQQELFQIWTGLVDRNCQGGTSRMCRRPLGAEVWERDGVGICHRENDSQGLLLPGRNRNRNLRFCGAGRRLH